MKIITTLFLCLRISLAAVEYPEISVDVKALDEGGNPLKGVTVQASDSLLTALIPGRHDEGLTSKNGVCSLKLKAAIGIEVYAFKEKEFYPSSEPTAKSTPFYYEQTSHETDDSWKGKKDNHSEEKIRVSGQITLRAIKNPIPLYVHRLDINFPAERKWLAFDLEKADWLPPFGAGENKDIYFRSKPSIKTNFNEKSKVAILEIKFGKGGGVVPVNDKNGFLSSSRMAMPYEAPREGYANLSILKFIQQNGGHPNPYMAKGYFFRTRVKSDENNVTKANYGKIIGSIRYDPIELINKSYEKNSGKKSYGGVKFTYYFNPKPNNRNLEFDQTHNLILGAAKKEIWAP